MRSTDRVDYQPLTPESNDYSSFYKHAMLCNLNMQYLQNGKWPECCTVLFAGLFKSVGVITPVAGCSYQLCVRVWLQRQSPSILQHWWLPTHREGQERWISTCAATTLLNKGQQGRSGSAQKQGNHDPFLVH